MLFDNHFEAHIFEYQREMIARKAAVRSVKMMKLFLIIGITLCLLYFLKKIGMNKVKANFLMSYPKALSLTLLSIILILIGWYTFDILLLFFAGILLAIFLRILTRFIKGILPFSDSIAVTCVLAILLISTLLVIKFSAPTISEQIAKLMSEIPTAWSKLQEFLSLKYLSTISEYFTLQQPLQGKNILIQAASFFTTTFGLFGSFIVFLFIGIFLAYDPETYKQGFLSLVSLKDRKKAHLIIEKLEDTLSWWIVGRLLSMSVIGLLTALGLWLLGVPLALTLGLLAAVLTFIPNIGPIVSVIPAILVALIQSPLIAIYVIFLYLAIQALESYIITPLIEKRTLLLPPVLIIFMQLVMAMLAGVLGLALATPILATIGVLIKTLYIENRETLKTD